MCFPWQKVLFLSGGSGQDWGCLQGAAVPLDLKNSKIPQPFPNYLGQAPHPECTALIPDGRHGAPAFWKDLGMAASSRNTVWREGRVLWEQRNETGKEIRGNIYSMANNQDKL